LGSSKSALNATELCNNGSHGKFYAHLTTIKEEEKKEPYPPYSSPSPY
jgi:hypothetical protein